MHLSDPFVQHDLEVVGYVRVSTEMQARDGKSLDTQVRRLRQFAEASGYKLNKVYQDIGSAARPGNLAKRPEFEQACREALSAGVPLLVSDVSRVSRDLEVLEQAVISRGLCVISVTEDGEVPVGVLRQLVGEAAEVARKSAEGTREALSRKKRSYPADIVSARQKAAQESCRARISKKFLVLDQAVDFLEAHPGLLDEASQKIADALNEAGILSGWSKPWTASAVRGKLKQIKNELDFRREMREQDRAGNGVEELWVDEERHLHNQDRIVPVVPAPCLIRVPQAPSDRIDPDEEEMFRNPLWGLF